MGKFDEDVERDALTMHNAFFRESVEGGSSSKEHIMICHIFCFCSSSFSCNRGRAWLRSESRTSTREKARAQRARANAPRIIQKIVLRSVRLHYCFSLYCFVINHLTYSGAKGNPKANYQCYKCRKWGHVASECRSR